MKIEEPEFVSEVIDQRYAVRQFEATMEQLMNDLEATLRPLAEFIETAINSDQIASAELQVTDADVQVKLQTSIINLPLEYINNINKIMIDAGTVPVNVYMIITAPKLNKSQLRIDELASTQGFQAANKLPELVQWASGQLDQLQQNLAAE
ncbi:hypothetical protein [Fructilactobacillus florum]|uniref:Uncharacterized protein n=1 Tax=Fructilactobacillus florum DSM 22689 = JCM 16035 TaxID=1423745 RepID=A0A0R2CIP6_9LACO|nr:hypothetical protein [Fructilactobacillus florum]KRM89860.1 hypothetical protein FC87_GL000274 [Fructilactobacillus florum DSM 22689 = JCM 16035]